MELGEWTWGLFCSFSYGFKLVATNILYPELAPWWIHIGLRYELYPGSDEMAGDVSLSYYRGLHSRYHRIGIARRRYKLSKVGRLLYGEYVSSGVGLNVVVVVQSSCNVEYHSRPDQEDTPGGSLTRTPKSFQLQGLGQRQKSQHEETSNKRRLDSFLQIKQDGQANIKIYSLVVEGASS